MSTGLISSRHIFTGLLELKTVWYFRYVHLLPQRSILFCSIIKEFGKKGDLVSALALFEASKKFEGQNMYVYCSIIDVCCVCDDCVRSRSIYEPVFSFNLLTLDVHYL